MGRTQLTGAGKKSERVGEKSKEVGKRPERMGKEPEEASARSEGTDEKFERTGVELTGAKSTGAKLKKISAKFEIVTPMFLGGAEHEATRIRGTAIKGALAFWWRALNFARFVKDADGDADDALRAMRCRERALFGSSNTGQGAFLLRVEDRKDRKLKTIKPPAQLRMDDGGLEDDVIGVGARYLGYGVINAFHTKANPKKNKPEKKEGQLERDCFAAGQIFSLELIFRPYADKTDIDEIIEALKLFGLLGGLGARVRRGWGSVALISLTAENLPAGVDASWQAPASREDYIACLQGLFENHPSRNHLGTDWSLTAFAKESQIHVGTDTQTNPLDVLNDLGDGFLRYRGWRNGDRNFADDRNWYRWYRTDNGDPGSTLCPPKRTAFGLPHSYAKWLGVVAADIPPEKLERRASPLLFHVHKAGIEAFYVASFLPTRFTVNGKIAISKNSSKTDVVYDFATAGLPVIESFLANQKPDGTTPAQNYFSATQVLP